MRNPFLYKLAATARPLPKQDHLALMSLSETYGYVSMERVCEWCDCSWEDALRSIKSLYDLGYLSETADGRFFQPQMLKAIGNGDAGRYPREPVAIARYKIRGGYISYMRRQAILARDQHTCAYCGYKGSVRDLGLDHVIPISEGGLTTEDNLVACCRPCNAEKSDLSLYQFIRNRLMRIAALLGFASTNLRNEIPDESLCIAAE